MQPAYFSHASAIIDPGARIGAGTRIWHFSHVMAGALVGRDCSLGQGVFVAAGARVGDRVKVQNNVSIYDGVTLEDDVFCGPSCVFTNVSTPRSDVSRKHAFVETRVGRGASIGANATIVCGASIGRFAMVGAGAVVARSVVPDYALMLGVPARRAAWVGRHGTTLKAGDDGVLRCAESGWRYVEEAGALRCIDRDESLPIGPVT
jgi:UDP-2-acetamido-3-amino-2,3-dideoxy-glucuronate N-acetyltransferase